MGNKRIGIVGGLIVDPANKVYSKLNLVLEAGKVLAVTAKPLDEYACERIIDAAGKIVAPGFIDMHMHEDPVDAVTGKLEDGIATCMLRMGVTTAVGGNCGINVLSPTEYFRQLDAEGAPVNIALLAGHTCARKEAGCKDKYAHITEEELARVKAVLKEYLDAGCLGISYGIRYVPGIDERELFGTAELCQADSLFIAAHVRDDAAYIFDAVRELLDAGQRWQLPVQVSHIGSMGGFGQMEQLLAMVDEYKANGLDVVCDCYPYYAFSTRIGETTYDDGFLERYNAGYDCVEVCEGKYTGQRCTKEIFDELRANAPRTITVAHVMKQEDVDMALLHPNVLLVTDGLLDQGQGHPRAAGSFPRFLANYVRTGKISLYGAVAKMTTLQAERLGLANKGRLNVGADADIVIFDLSTVQDRATFAEPTLAPEGIEYVLIGGEVALEKGKLVNNRLGKAIKRSR